MRELISPSKKKKAQAGNEWLNILPKPPISFEGFSGNASYRHWLGGRSISIDDFGDGYNRSS